MRRRHCLVFAVHPASCQLPRLACAARRTQERPTGTFRKVRRRSMQIYSPPGTARSFARRCACSELAGIRLLIRSRRHSLKYSLDPQTRAPTGCTNTRTPTECLACSNSPGLPFPHASWLPCLPLAARQPRVLFGPLLPCWHYSMRVRLHRPVYCVVDAGAHAEQTL